MNKIMSLLILSLMLPFQAIGSQIDLSDWEKHHNQKTRYNKERTIELHDGDVVFNLQDYMKAHQDINTSKTSTQKIQVGTEFSKITFNGKYSKAITNSFLTMLEKYSLNEGTHEVTRSEGVESITVTQDKVIIEFLRDHSTQSFNGEIELTTLECSIDGSKCVYSIEEKTEVYSSKIEQIQRNRMISLVDHVAFWDNVTGLSDALNYHFSGSEVHGINYHINEDSAVIDVDGITETFETIFSKTFFAETKTFCYKNSCNDIVVLTF